MARVAARHTPPRLRLRSARDEGPYSRKVRQRSRHQLSSRPTSRVSELDGDTKRQLSREFASKRSGFDLRLSNAAPIADGSGPTSRPTAGVVLAGRRISNAQPSAELRSIM